MFERHAVCQKFHLSFEFCIEINYKTCMSVAALAAAATMVPPPTTTRTTTTTNTIVFVFELFVLVSTWHTAILISLEMLMLYQTQRFD